MKTLGTFKWLGCYLAITALVAAVISPPTLGFWKTLPIASLPAILLTLLTWMVVTPTEALAASWLGKYWPFKGYASCDDVDDEVFFWESPFHKLIDELDDMTTDPIYSNLLGNINHRYDD